MGYNQIVLFLALKHFENVSMIVGGNDDGMRWVGSGMNYSCSNVNEPADNEPYHYN